MSGHTGYYHRVESNGRLKFIVLGYRDAAAPSENLEAWITPTQGANLCRFIYGNSAIIDSNMDALGERGFPGTPVLYPTPNRVRNGRFIYKNRTYDQVKNGKKIVLHGLVLNEEWENDEPRIEEDGVAFNTWIDFSEGAPVFEAFPFRHRLTLHYCLGKAGIGITYTVRNLDRQEIPFGFGLHPFFRKLSGDGETYVRLPANCVMDATSDLLPTGRLIDVEGTVYDLRKPDAVGKRDLDHVFTCLDPDSPAEIQYRTLGFSIIFKATPDFSHIVFYSPRGSDIFCLENQTCSTDAHNLHDLGFEKEACLRTVPVGGEHSGTVEFQIKKLPPAI